MDQYDVKVLSLEDNIVNMLSSIFRKQEVYSYIATLLHNANVDTKAIKKLFKKNNE